MFPIIYVFILTCFHRSYCFTLLYDLSMSSSMCMVAWHILRQITGTRNTAVNYYLRGAMSLRNQKQDRRSSGGFGVGAIRWVLPRPLPPFA